MAAVNSPSGRVLAIPAKPDFERDAVAAAWHRAGGKVERLDRFWEPPKLDANRVTVYGPATFALVLAQVLRLHLISPPDDLLLTLPPAATRRAIGSVELAAALRLDFPLFVKPVVPKLFRARVYSTATDLTAETHGLEPDTAVIWSAPTTFAAEVRMFATDRDVFAEGVYEGTLSADAMAACAAFAGSVLRYVNYAGPLVLDVGLINGEWSVIEFNEAWGAGLNGCDASDCLEVIAAASQPA
jgi:hypothetical protein